MPATIPYRPADDSPSRHQILKKQNFLRIIGIYDCMSASRLTAEGRCARSSRHARRGGGGRGRSQRLLLEGADERSVADVKSQRPDTPMLVSRADAQASRNGGQKARRTRETAYKREAHRAGNAGMSRLNLWYLPPAFFSQAGHGCGQRPAFPAPSALFARDEFNAELGHEMPRDRGAMSFDAAPVPCVPSAV